MSDDGWKHVDDFEHTLMQRWSKEGKSISQIASLLERDQGTVRKHVDAKGPKATIGRPRKIGEKEWTKLHKVLGQILQRAKAKKEVTVAMVIAASRLNVSEKVALEAFHAHGVYFHKLFERPVLEQQDVPARLAWATARLRRTRKDWLKRPHAVIDNKHFQIYHTKAGRSHAARRSVRGAFRQEGAEPAAWLVRQKDTIRFPAPGVTVTAAVIKGRVRVWDYVAGKWNAAAAVKMYKGPLRRALKRAYPEVLEKRGGKFNVLEDNDPAGYKSRAALAAKVEANVVTDDLPARSPDLNVLDYSLWHEINTRMRKQEAAFPANKKETKAAYLQRLRKTALGLPSGLVERAIADMHRRVRSVVAAKGGLFKE